MFRKPLLWGGLVAVSLACLLFAAKYFSQAFPLVTLDLKMDREQALASARMLAEQNYWAPDSFKQAASFGVDNEVQTYVELEAGGSPALAEMLQGDLFMPYQWHVRHFQQEQSNETHIYFTPSGQPYGFSEKLSEATDGASLQPDSARTIAETSAVADWQINFSDYTLIEQSQEIVSSGRVDHTFVYERPGVKIAEGSYRLRLVVGGDQLTELRHFVHIPEAFSRKYEEMRSANDTIAFGASMAMGLLYILGGCIIGLFFLLRQRWVQWRRAVHWGLFIAALQFLAGLNQLPLSWMMYDTALSTQTFLLQQIAASLANALLMAALLILSFIAAESLTRKAFPNQLQLWKLWSKDVAGSKTVLGMTIAGYLLVSVFFAYDVGLYLFSQNWLGWWTPSDMLFHPDALATYFPWLTSIAISAQAGFWEEALFRAVPIAGAALLGERFGQRKWWIAGAFILQAIVFGAGHANYPAQPAYARLVELILPSIGFGLIFLRFGLLPAVILHFTFDVVWFALPLFVADTPNAWINQVLVVALALLPLGVVLYRRLQAGAWKELPENIYNRAWSPPQIQAESQAETTPSLDAKGMTPIIKRAVFALGILGLISWVLLADFSTDAPPMKIDRQTAIAHGEKALLQKGIELGTKWKLLSTVDAPNNENDRFVWQTAGPEVYSNLLGTYLGPPYWRLRYVQFEGDVAARAEEYELHVDADGSVFRFVHKLPESQPGDSLDEAQARSVADSIVQASFGLQPSVLKFISSEPSKREARQDWLFTFADTTNSRLVEGEKRISVQISGREVTDAMRYVHVPEAWQRTQRNERTLPRIFEIGSIVVLVLLVIAGAILAMVHWSRKQFQVKSFFVIMASLFLLSVLNVFNNWPTLEMQFSTAQPYKNQAAIFVLGGLLSAVFMSAAVGLVVGLVHAWYQQTKQELSVQISGLAITVGVMIAGLFAVFASIKPATAPIWPDYSAAGAFVPLLPISLGPLSGFITRTAILLLVFVGLNRLTQNGTKNLSFLVAIFLLVGLVFSGTTGIATIGSWLISGMLIGLALWAVYHFVLRFEPAMIPIAVATLAVFAQFKGIAHNAVPGAIVGAVLAIFLICTSAFLWFNALVKK
ncbi:CPBP family intramembrane metalloprotease [candidate division KSB1 bacterium]|nr:CPBP family intramembrane metalloprotease [candidate division KSB1 bacterium]